MHSLRSRLTLALVVGMGLPLAGAGLLMNAVMLAVVCDWVQLDELLRSLPLTLSGVIAGLFIIMVILVRLALRLGLRPLVDVQQQVAQLDINTLNIQAQFHTQTLELMPIVHQLNAMRCRLDDAFARERQFSSDVAHELRTPLAELRTLAEVGSRWSDDRDAVVDYFADARAICEQMEGVVISLLTLTRCESGVQQVQRQPLNVLDAVETSWLTVQQLAQEKAQAFECHIPTALEIASDRDMVLMVLRNLLGNAVLYSAPKSTIRCAVTNIDSKPQLTISNPVEHLNSDPTRRTP